MAINRGITFSLKHGLKNFHNAKLIAPVYLKTMVVSTRCISSMEVTKNLSLLSKEKKNIKIVNLKLQCSEEKPLVVMLSWLMARKKHIYKYADIYIKHGFDVLNVSVNPWQLLWPVKGTQIVAADILKFIHLNNTYAPLLLHGFSVGAYVWSEVMVQMASELTRYQHVIDRISGQVWDSAADITEISIGLPVAVFPKNKVMQKALRQYVTYHLKTFDRVATSHYIRSSQMFHTNLVKAPALLLLSKADPIGAEASNLRAKENWESMNMKVFWKCWEKSPHVGHYRRHPDEYTKEIYRFLDEINIPNVQAQESKRIKAKL